MSEVVELLAIDAAVQDVGPVLSPGFIFPGAAVAPTKPLRFGKAHRWSSALCEQDLQCLLRVIECDLIPQLLTGYSPARYAIAALPPATD
ncbi:MAG: hypothetical protein ABI277_15380 [Burkholderiaceae bacterium]